MTQINQEERKENKIDPNPSSTNSDSTPKSDNANKNSFFTTKNVLIVTLCFFLGIFLIVASYSAYSLVQLQKPVSEITVSGIASRQVKPSKGKVTLFYSESSENAETLNLKADEITKKVTDYIISEGINKNQIVTNKSTFPDYQYGPQGELNNDRLIRVEATIEVNFENLQDDLEKPNRIIKEATNLGITYFYPFTYEIAESEEICEELVDEAINNAFEKGSNRVKNIGGTNIVTREIISVERCNNGLLYPSRGNAMDAVSSESGATFTPKLLTGEQKIESRVEVKFVYR
jgi:uncharacterized protein YggE